jgi:hypothetical protein
LALVVAICTLQGGTYRASMQEFPMPQLSPRLHGACDLVVGVAFLAAPSLFGLPQLPEALCYMFAGLHLLLTAVTAFPMGVVRSMSLPVHGALEFLVALLLVALPWLMGFDHAEAARNVFVLLGVFLFALWLATDYQADAQHHRDTNHHDRVDSWRGPHAPVA